MRRNPIAKGRGLRGVIAWVAGALAAALVAASMALVYLIVREHLLHPPFGGGEFWVFLNLWRPMVMVGAIVTLVLGAPLALIAVAILKRARWPRPHADIALGACGGVIAVWLVLAVFNLVFDFGA